MADKFYYGHGKILLTSEYFVLDGAKAIGLPTTVGQSMIVKTKPGYQPVLKWESLTHHGQKWFEAEYDVWHFQINHTNDKETAVFLQKILKQVRKQNIHFLREEAATEITTKLEFPLEWGLGSSSSLIYNIAQWAYVGPFELLSNSIGGSGYDIACAQSMGPILYQLKDKNPEWKPVEFNPQFADQLYFIYLGNKMNSREGIKQYLQIPPKERLALINSVNSLTEETLSTQNLKTFEKIIIEHERVLGSLLNVEPIKKQRFEDYWGEIKSLGAWGGDFILATSEESFEKTREYFSRFDLTTIIPFRELIKTQTWSHQ
jgi:mevalonate kinase